MDSAAALSRFLSFLQLCLKWQFINISYQSHLGWPLKCRALSFLQTRWGKAWGLQCHRPSWGWSLRPPLASCCLRCETLNLVTRYQKLLSALSPSQALHSPWITLFLPPLFDFPRRRGCFPPGFHSSRRKPLIEHFSQCVTFTGLFVHCTGLCIPWEHEPSMFSSSSCSQCLVCFWQIAGAP